MPRPVAFAFFVEVILVLVTLVLTTQPRFLIHPRSEKIKGIVLGLGLAFLCATFCWSFILGCVMALHHTFWFET